MECIDVDLPAATLLCVQYPGYVASLPKVMATIGGDSAVERAYNNSNALLELRFRPNNPAAHPIRAVREPANGILLKIRRKKSSSLDPSREDEEAAVESVEVLGVIRSEFKFSGTDTTVVVVCITCLVAHRLQACATFSFCPFFLRSNRYQSLHLQSHKVACDSVFRLLLVVAMHDTRSFCALFAMLGYTCF